jgi:hypothetical protein
MHAVLLACITLKGMIWPCLGQKASWQFARGWFGGCKCTDDGQRSTAAGVPHTEALERLICSSADHSAAQEACPFCGSKRNTVQALQSIAHQLQLPLWQAWPSPVGPASGPKCKCASASIIAMLSAATSEAAAQQGGCERPPPLEQLPAFWAAPAMPSQYFAMQQAVQCPPSSCDIHSHFEYQSDGYRLSWASHRYTQHTRGQRWRLSIRGEHSLLAVEG